MWIKIKSQTDFSFRFFEATVVYDYVRDPVTNETIDYSVHLEPTEMRTAPLYTMYFNWSRLIVLGIIPFVMLVYLNAKIYKDIQVLNKHQGSISSTLNVQIFCTNVVFLRTCH